MDKSKNKRAVAIKYDKGDVAPKVVAKGQGYVAQKILEKAEDQSITVYKDEKLVKELSTVEIGSNIPQELYEAVAAVLVFISYLDKLAKHNKHVK